MIYTIHPAVQQEYDQAFVWHENKQTGLGDKFSKEIFSAINAILSNPEAWTIIDNHGHRKYVIDSFSYKIIYKYYQKKQICSIIAIVHDRQRQGYWKERI
jgi:plasmid stabilization system protein ParE